jgi:hypothetical protein
MRLTDNELALLQAWIWEHANGRGDGPAHRLAKENLGDLLVIVLVASPLLAAKRHCRLTRFLNSPAPQIPRIWPWPNMTSQEIMRSLQHRVDQRIRDSRPWSAISGALLLGVGLTTFLCWVGAGLLVSAVGAVIAAFGLYVLRDELERRHDRRLSRLLTRGKETSEDGNRAKRSKHNGLSRDNEGWDHFILEPGMAETKSCRVCGATTEVVRNIKGHPGYVSFLCGIAEDHDLFLCKHMKEPWHQQALALMKMAEATPSATRQAELEQEIQRILTTRTPTKGSWSIGPHSASITG